MWWPNCVMVACVLCVCAPHPSSVEKWYGRSVLQARVWQVLPWCRRAALPLTLVLGDG